jgi:hypothetical protein
MIDRELSEAENLLLECIRMLQERHAKELAPYYKRLADIQALTPTPKSYYVSMDEFLEYSRFIK